MESEEHVENASTTSLGSQFTQVEVVEPPVTDEATATESTGRIGTPLAAQPTDYILAC